MNVLQGWPFLRSERSPPKFFHMWPNMFLSHTKSDQRRLTKFCTVEHCLFLIHILQLCYLSQRQKIGARKFNEGDSSSISWTIKLGVKFPPHFSPSSFILWDNIVIDPYLQRMIVYYILKGKGKDFMIYSLTPQKQMSVFGLGWNKPFVPFSFTPSIYYVITDEKGDTWVKRKETVWVLHSGMLCSFDPYLTTLLSF